MHTVRTFSNIYLRVLPLVLPLLLLTGRLTGQHMLEQRYTLDDGLPYTEVYKIGQDREGYIWTTTTNSQLSRFDGQEFVTYPPAATGSKQVYGIRHPSYVTDIIGYTALGEGYDKYWLLRGDSIMPYPDEGIRNLGVNLVDSSAVLIGDNALYLTVPGQTVIVDTVAVPTIDSHHVVSAYKLTNSSYYIKYVNPADRSHRGYWFDGRDTIFIPEEQMPGFFFADGSYLHYTSSAPHLVTHYGADRKIFQQWRWQQYFGSDQQLSRIRVVRGRYYVIRQNKPPKDDDEQQSLTIFTWDPATPATLNFYGSCRLPSAHSYRIQIAHDGTVWMPSHAGLHRMVPHTEAYVCSDREVVDAMHAVGELANGDVYVGGFGTGFMRIRDRQPERLARPPYRADLQVLPGSFRAQDGGLLFIDQNRSKPIIKIGPTGAYRSPAMPKVGTGFIYHPLQLPAGAKLSGKTINQPGKYLAIGMTSAPALDEPFGRIGLTPLPYEPDGPFHFVGKAQGMRLRNVLCLAQDRRDRIWFGHSRTGIGVYDAVRDTAITWLKDQPSDPGAVSMLIDDYDRLWLGSARGLYFVDSVSALPFQPSPHLRERQKKCRIHAIPDSYIGGLFLLGRDTLVVSHQGGLSFVDLRSDDIAHPQAATIPVHKYLGGSEQNAIMQDREGQLWVILDNGITRLNYKEILRGRGMQSELEIAVKGDNGAGTKIGWSDVTIPVNDRSLNYGYRLGVGDQLRDEVRTELLLRSQDGDTVRYHDAVASGAMLRENYLPPGTYVLEARSYFDNQLQDERMLTIYIPKRWRECWWFWPGLILLIALPIVLLALYRYQRVRAALDRERLENERQQALLVASEARSESERLQVSTLSNAVNPHFISNALQWLSSAYLVGRPQAKIDEMSHELSKTIRTMFTNSTDGIISHSLVDELQLVERYLRTVNIQYDERFTFDLPPPARVKAFSRYEVLLMQVQVHVENAVEHGLRYRPAGRTLRIRLEEDEALVRIIVEDDGAGVDYVRERQERQGHRPAGRGTTIMRRLHETFNRYNALPITTTIVSPIFTSNSGTTYGTRVVIQLPKTYHYVIENDRR